MIEEMATERPAGLAASVEMEPATHGLHCVASSAGAVKPTWHGLQRSPSMLAVPARQGVQVPAVVGSSEESSLCPSKQVNV